MLTALLQPDRAAPLRPHAAPAYRPPVSLWSRLFGSKPSTPPAEPPRPADPNPTQKPSPSPNVTRSPPLDPRSLRLQLFSAELARMFDLRSMLARPLSPHLTAIVVEDILGQSEHTLTRAELTALGLSDDALFTRARENAVAADLPHAQTMRSDTAAGPIDIFISNKFYLGALVLTQLEQQNQDTLVVLLTWHHALMHVLDASSSVATVTTLADMATSISEAARCQPMEWLSPQIHLYRAADRSLTPVTLGLDPTPHITAPAELAARLGA